MTPFSGRERILECRRSVRRFRERLRSRAAVFGAGRMRPLRSSGRTRAAQRLPPLLDADLRAPVDDRLRYICPPGKPGMRSIHCTRSLNFYVVLTCCATFGVEFQPTAAFYVFSINLYHTLIKCTIRNQMQTTSNRVYTLERWCLFVHPLPKVFAIDPTLVSCGAHLSCVNIGPN